LYLEADDTIQRSLFLIRSGWPCRCLPFS